MFTPAEAKFMLRVLKEMQFGGNEAAILKTLELIGSIREKLTPLAEPPTEKSEEPQAQEKPKRKRG